MNGSKVFLSLGLGCLAAVFARADNLTEAEAESLKVVRTVVSDDYEQAGARDGAPRLFKAPISNGLLVMTGQAEYRADDTLEIFFPQRHFFTPKDGRLFFVSSMRLYALSGGAASLVCRASLGEFTVRVEPSGPESFTVEKTDMAARRRKLEFPASALPADLSLFARKDGGFAVILTSLADGSRRTIAGDAAFFREEFANGFDAFLRLEAAKKGTPVSLTVDNRTIAEARMSKETAAPVPAVSPDGTFDPDRAGWTRVFEDDFDGPSLDKAKWKTMPWAKHPDAAALDGEGHLAITCDFAPGTTNLVSTSLWSVPSFRYGYFEAKVKFTKNNGWWSAFWLYGSSNKNPMIDGSEIDIFEDYYTRSAKPEGPHRPILDHNLHVSTGDALKSWNYKSELPGTLDDWYVIGCKWTPFEISYYVNGRLVSSKANHSPYSSVTFDALNHAALSAPLHVVLSGCIMKSWGHRNTTGFTFPERFLVDSVRVWAMPEKGLPRPSWKTSQTRAAARAGERISYSADIASDKPVVAAWLFDNGYPVASRTEPPWDFEIPFDQSAYAQTRYGKPGRSGVVPPWDRLTHFFKVYARDADGRVGVTEEYRYRVPETEAVSTPWKGKAHAVPGTILPWQFDEGGREVGHHSLSAKPRKNRLRADTAFDCRPKTVMQLRTGEWMGYTVDVQTAGTYRVELNYGTGNDARNTVELVVDGLHRGTFDCPFPGKWDWSTRAARPLEDLALKKGRHAVKLVVTGYLSVGTLDFKLEKEER